MNKSQKVRHVFSELADVLGSTMSKQELLECASLITEACDNPLKNNAFFHEGKTPLCELPVNQVIDTWSWELVDDDYKAYQQNDVELQDDYMMHIPNDIKWQQLLSAA
jgi:hypothetical protein